ncbi:hypothetical protein RJ640_021196, partial [Escallonia rubra]
RPTAWITGWQVEVENVGIHERKTLVERLVKIPEEDNEKFLLKLKNRTDTVGINLSTIQIRFEHLNVEAKAYAGSRSLPTSLNFNINILEFYILICSSLQKGFLNCLHILPSRKNNLAILQAVSGIIRPCRMTLLLGPPNSGKTTSILALAGKLDLDLKCTGRVTYNGHGMDEFVPQGTAAYISQHNLHIGEMTVRETLAFSARCQGVGSRYELSVELSIKENKNANIKPDPDIDVYMKVKNEQL